MTNPARKIDAPAETVAERQQRTTMAVRNAPAGTIPAEIKDEIGKVKVMHKVAKEIANLTWGRELNQKAALAIAMWADRNGIDITEFDLLGGRLYKNGVYYLNRAAPFIRSGKIAYLRADHIHADPRLEEMAKGSDKDLAAKAKAESDRRKMERVAYNVKEDALAAVVARCGVLRGGQVVEYTGCKWIEKGRTRDPVGQDRPVETCETRAYRRVLRLVVPEIGELATAVSVADDDGVGVEEVIAETKDQAKLQAESVRPIPQGEGNPAWVRGDVYGSTPLDERPPAGEFVVCTDCERNIDDQGQGHDGGCKWYSDPD